MLKDNLRISRTNRHMSMESVANAIGITTRRVFSYESGETEPDCDTLVRFSNLYDTTVDWLLGHHPPLVMGKDIGEHSIAKFGMRVRQLREEKNLPTSRIASTVGISQQYFLSIENGSKIPRLEVALKILNALNMSADFAFMDSITAAHSTRAKYLEIKMCALAPNNQRLFMDIVESSLNALIENEKHMMSESYDN